VTLDFRKRLLLALSLFSIIPAAVVTVAWAVVTWRALPLVTAGAAWDRVVDSGNAALTATASDSLSADARTALQVHARELEAAATQARRLEFVIGRFAPVVALGASAVLLLVALAASRVAGHLSRQLSRPVHELVGWTQTIRSGTSLPARAVARGAPEFEVLRTGMREMAAELEAGRQRAVEAERLLAFRETARRVAHELKNPLTPMQFALANLRRFTAPEGAESLRVLEEETGRLQRMATSFSQFGTLPSGPAAPVDMAELLRTTATACVPSHLALRLELPTDLPPLVAHHDALQRAVMNVILNAVDACGNAGTITVRARQDGSSIATDIADSGPGIDHELLPHVFQPYVTRKPGGTGLGLAIAQQVVQSHGGTIVALSPPGGGTTIRFHLPVHPAEVRT
jgi:signal transduction histidine kinase